ncbi:hypothetical protein DSO57_1008787 [Entomophthora muscae]|nr:hypothetical protein DSO57_1008787 [Entomophthora muscae]
MRHFVNRVGLDVDVNELTPSSSPYKDSVLTVHAAHVLPVNDAGYVPNSETCSVLELKDPDLAVKRELVDVLFSYQNEQKNTKLTREELMEDIAKNGGNKPKRLKVKAPSHPLMRGRIPPTFPRSVAISYICHTADVLGTFNPVAAKALGLKPGPIFAQLKKGNTITTPEGVVIRPEQCVGPSKKGPIFMVLDCPTEDYIPGLVNHPKFQAYKSGQQHSVVAIIHNTGAAVVLDPDYIEFMKSFGPETQHIMCSPDVCAATLNFLRSAQSILALSSLDSDIFSLPYHNTAGSIDVTQLAKDHGLKIAPAVPRMLCQISGTPKIDLPTPQMLLPLSDQGSICHAALEQMSAFRSSVEKMEKITATKSEGPFVTTLGTGSALPSLTRNVSSNLVTLPSGNMILLDTGEGTLGQLFRHLGTEPFKNPKLNASIQDFYDRLSIIYISHPHADHHLGILQVMQEVYHNTKSKKKRYLVMPRSMYAFLCEFAQTQDIGIHLWEFISCYDLTSVDYFKRRYSDMEDVDLIRTCRVNHCQEAFGVSFDFSCGFKLVYSGDTRPCQALVDIGMDADLLIHEATMNDELLDDAKAKRHSTISEALDQGKLMNARQVLLTHFSQRYPGCAFTSGAESQPVAVGFDLMCLDVGKPPEGAANDLERFKTFYKPLGSFFAEAAAEESEDLPV